MSDELEKLESFQLVRGSVNNVKNRYYHFRSNLKRDDFFAYVYFSNVTVSQTSASPAPMKMRCFGRETNNVCQTTVACFVHVAGRFSSFRLYFSSYNLLIGWQVLGFQILSRITQMAPVQIKVVYDYYSPKRTTPFFITEEELLNLDFHSFKSRLLLEVPHLAKSTSAKALRLTMSDENLEVDYDFALLFLQPIDVLLLWKDFFLCFTHVSLKRCLMFIVVLGFIGGGGGAPFEHFV